MNTTSAPTLQQLQHKRNQPNGMKVPNLLQTPEEFHELYLEISRCRSISCFTQGIHKNRIILRLTLRTGEIYNQVVRARIKSLFEGHNCTLQIHGRDIVVTLKRKDVR